MSRDRLGRPPSDEARRERQRIVEYLKYHEEMAHQRSKRKPATTSDNVHGYVSGYLLGIIDAIESGL